jgi:hypothetical protein
MSDRDRPPALGFHEIPSDHKFAADQFALLAVHERLDHPKDRADLKRLVRAGEEVARRLLFKNGFGHGGRGDLRQAASECIGDLLLNLRRAEMRGREAGATEALSIRQLFERIQGLSASSEPQTPATAVLRCGDPETPAHAQPTSAAQLLSALRDMWNRLLTTTPARFDAEATPWTSPQIVQVLSAARKRIAAYTICALTHLCVSAVRDPNHAKTRLLHGEEDDALVERDQVQRAGRVQSPHMHAVVRKACEQALAELDRVPPTSEAEARNRPYVRALIESVPLLLESPDEKLFVLTKLRLQESNLPPDDFKRGFMAATRHMRYRQLCDQIQRGAAWH